MKNRIYVLILISILITGCSKKIEDNTYQTMESSSSGTYEEEGKEQAIEEMIDGVQEEINPEEMDETVQEESLSEKMTGEEQEEDAEPVFMEFDELCFLESDFNDPDNYLVFYLYADGTFDGEIRHIWAEDGLSGTYNRFFGRFEIEKKVGDGVYLLRMPELYLMFEPESKVKIDGENGTWTGDSVDSLVQGFYFYLCLAGADVNCLPLEYLEDSYSPIPFAEDVFTKILLLTEILMKEQVS